MNTLRRLWLYLIYWLRASNAHGLHSPFVFQLYNEVINADKYYYAFDDLEALRFQLLTNYEKINITDFGTRPSRQQTIAQIANSALSSPPKAQLLFKLIDFFAPTTIVELGTSLGLGTLYLSKAAPKNAHIYTFEGCPQLVARAKNLFTNEPITVFEGNLEQTLAPTLQKLPPLDFVFFDANHRQEPTLRYFENCLKHAHENSVFVFDDIYWSADMTAAWQQIKKHPQTMLTIDLFSVGLVFFRTKQPKQHFRLRF